MSAVQLLRQLEPAVRPGSAAAAPVRPATALHARSFHELLSQAASGAISSGRQIQLGFDPQPPLQPAQLERLAQAADLAEAAGARQAVMLIDGRAFTLDVSSRSLTGELTGAGPGESAATRVVSVDAAVVIAAADLNGPANLLKLPGERLGNPRRP